METKEKFDRNQYLGAFRGFVRDNDDPERRLRVRCHVPAVLGNELLTDWCWPAGSWYGGVPDAGLVAVPEIGASVLVEFENGDVNRPMYSAVWWGQKDGVNHVPKLVRGEKDETAQAPKGQDSFTSGDGSVHRQPSSPYAAKYPENVVLKTQHERHVIEVDDTPGKGRLHLWHGTSKSFVEIGPDGTRSDRTAGRKYEEIGANDETHVKGSRHVGVDGADSLRVRGSQTVKILGSRKTFVFGDDTEIVLGSKMTTVMLQYARVAGVRISDRARLISHNP